MNQYEKENALFHIDGYFCRRLNETNAAAFQRAVEEYKQQALEAISRAEQITIEQLAEYKGECWESKWD